MKTSLKKLLPTAFSFFFAFYLLAPCACCFASISSTKINSQAHCNTSTKTETKRCHFNTPERSLGCQCHNTLTILNETLTKKSSDTNFTEKNFSKFTSFVASYSPDLSIQLTFNSLPTARSFQTSPPLYLLNRVLRL